VSEAIVAIATVRDPNRDRKRVTTAVATNAVVLATTAPRPAMARPVKL
jgi:hypothetical protein